MTTKLKTTCPSCEQRLRVDEAKRGRTVRCPSCQETFTASETFAASETTIDTAPAAVSVDTTQLAKDETLADLISPAAQSLEEATLRKLGRFELKSVLGAGGFGKVYRAYDPQLERFVALKVPTFGPNQKTRIARFLAEAKAAARLKHANIVSTFETGKADKKYYIASEYIEGELLSALAKRERFAVKEAVLILQKLAEAVAYAHSQGIVHRDIKPHNVMIDSAGEPQLMDFGLAKRTDDSSNLTTDGALLGTPAYMAPEQARGELHLVNQFSDQYSLGVVLYYLLTGATPCQGSPHMVIAEVARGEFHSVRDRNGTIDRTLDAICQKAMHPQQAQRYSDCHQFVEDLDAWVNNSSVLARPLSKLRGFTRTLREQQLPVILFSIIVILSALATAIASKLSQRDRSTAGLTTSEMVIKPDEPQDWASTEQRPEPSTMSAEDSTGPSGSRPTEPTQPTSPLLSNLGESTDAVHGNSSRQGETEVDLLASIAFAEEHLIQGSGRLLSNTLILENAKNVEREDEALIEIPVAMPQSYVLRIEFEKDNSPACFAICCPHQGSEVTVVLDGWSGSGLSEISGKRYSENACHVSAMNLINRGVRQSVQITSSADGLVVNLNGRVLTEFSGSPKRLSVEPASRHPNPMNVAMRLAHEGKLTIHSVFVDVKKGECRPVIPPFPRQASSLEQASQTFRQPILYLLQLADRIGGRLSIETSATGQQRLKISAQRGKLRWNTLTDKDFQDFGRFNGPFHLDLKWTKGWSIEGLKALQQCENLQVVCFEGCPVMENTLFSAIPTSNLVGVNVCRTKIDDGIAQHLMKMKKLTWAVVHESSIGDETLSSLSGLESLEEVTIGGKEITDNGLAILSGSDSLKVVRIWNNLGNYDFRRHCSPNVTNESLRHLVGMKSLATLAIERTLITADAIEDFHRNRPSVDVDFRALTEEESKVVESLAVEGN